MVVLPSNLTRSSKDQVIDSKDLHLAAGPCCCTAGTGYFQAAEFCCYTASHCTSMLQSVLSCILSPCLSSCMSASAGRLGTTSDQAAPQLGAIRWLEYHASRHEEVMHREALNFTVLGREALYCTVLGYMQAVHHTHNYTAL